MATSLISGLIADGYDAKRLTVSDPDSEKLAQLAARFGIHPTADNQQAVANADVVVLAVKPQILKAVAADLAPAIQRHQPLVISIAAGVQESALRRWLGDNVALVRSHAKHTRYDPGRRHRTACRKRGQQRAEKPG